LQEEQKFKITRPANQTATVTSSEVFNWENKNEEARRK